MDASGIVPKTVFFTIVPKLCQKWQKFIKSAKRAAKNGQKSCQNKKVHFFRLPIAGAASIPGIDLDFPRNLTLSQWVDKMMTTGTLSGIHIDYLYATLVPTAVGFDELLMCMIELQLAVVVDVSLKIRPNGLTNLPISLKAMVQFLLSFLKY